MKIMMGNSTELDVIRVDGGSRYFNGVTRDTLDFVFARESYTFDYLCDIFSNERLTMTIVIVDGDQRWVHDDYTLMVSISRQVDTIQPSTPGSAETVEARYHVVMAQMTYAENQQEKVKNIAAISFVYLAEEGAFDPATLGEHASLFADWVEGGEAQAEGRVGYRAGQLRTDPADGALYKCSQTHYSEHATEPPSKSPTLWGRIADPGDEWPPWFPFNGSNADAWMIGGKCSHLGKRWRSTVDHNVWEPGVYGWEEVI